MLQTVAVNDFNFFSFLIFLKLDASGSLKLNTPDIAKDVKPVISNNESGINCNLLPNDVKFKLVKFLTLDILTKGISFI